MYAYPGYVTDRLVEVMAGQPQVLPYLDMPLQHAHPDTLKRMRRPANMDWVYRTLENMRRAMPDLTLRTTMIVGYPGETEEEFQALLDFAEEIRFDRLGAFTFSFEPGTSSEPLGDPVPQEVKEERLGRLMTLQQRISLENNQALVGQSTAGADRRPRRSGRQRRTDRHRPQPPRRPRDRRAGIRGRSAAAG